MSENRPEIPLPTKREVRQRCGFGCVICGCPLYEYHHMEDYATSQNHDPDNLTLLCDGHHKQATNKLLTSEEIRKANQSPCNVARGISSPFGLKFSGTDFRVCIGGNQFSGFVSAPEDCYATIPIAIDDIDLLWIKADKSGNIFVNANIFDEFNLLVLQVTDNHLMYRTDTWDIAFVGRTLAIREASGRFLIEITFEPPNQITIDRARLLCNGVELVVRKSHVFIVNSGSILVRNTATNCVVGLQLGRNDRRLGAGYATKPKFLPRYLLEQSEVRRREVDAIEEQKEMLKSVGISHDFAMPR